jgi:hypothetical protein
MDDLTRRWITVPVAADLLRGAVDVERTERGVLPHRLPAWARAQNTDSQLAMAESHPAGVRVAFRTGATDVELETVPTKRFCLGAPPFPDGVYDLLVNGELAGQGSVPGGNTLTIDMAAGTLDVQPGPSGTLRFSDLPGGVKDLEIWLPHKETTELIALRANAPIEPLPPGGRRVWLHHGSSISHGSDAASPSTTWPALAARLGGVDLINLGLAGSALLDPFTARTLRDTSADVISLKLGINLVNTDLMRLRAFTPAVHGFLDTIREGHPTTPLLVTSPILCPIHEDTPGPSTPDLGADELMFKAANHPEPQGIGKLTLTIIRDELDRIVKQRSADDPNLHYLDGRDLYGEADFAELPLPDQLHPDAATHHLIGTRFATHAFAKNGPLSP